MTKELEYRCRVIVELHDGNDEPARDAEPFRIVEILTSYINASLEDVEHEVDTDRGTLVEREVEVTQVKHMKTDHEPIANNLFGHVIVWNRLRQMLENIVLVSAETAVEKSEASEAEEVWVEADS